jgi:hypothetical protein
MRRKAEKRTVRIKELSSLDGKTPAIIASIVIASGGSSGVGAGMYLSARSSVRPMRTAYNLSTASCSYTNKITVMTLGGTT